MLLSIRVTAGDEHAGLQLGSICKAVHSVRLPPCVSGGPICGNTPLKLTVASVGMQQAGLDWTYRRLELSTQAHR